MKENGYLVPGKELNEIILQAMNFNRGEGESHTTVEVMAGT